MIIFSAQKTNLGLADYLLHKALYPLSPGYLAPLGTGGMYTAFFFILTLI